MRRPSSSHFAAVCSSLVLFVAGCDTTVTTSVEASNAGHTGTSTTSPSRIRIVLADTIFRSIRDSLHAGVVVTNSAGTALNASPVWTVTNPSVVALGVEPGLSIAQAPGQSLLIASYAGISDTARLTVSPVGVLFLIPQPQMALSAIGATGAASAIVTDARGTQVSGVAIAFSSSAPSVGTVSAAGLVTAIGAGTAFIRLQTAGSLRDSIRLTVTLPQTDITVSSLTLAKHQFASDAIGDTLSLAATARTASGTVVNASSSIVYRSLDPSIVMVGPTGAGWTVSAGTGRLVASVGTVSDTATVTVQPTATSIRLNVATASFAALGQTATLVATPLDRLGSPVVGAPITWASSNPAVASVTAAGLVTGLTNGTTIITASSGALSAIATVTVALPAPVPAALAFVSRTGVLTAINDTLRLLALARDASGTVLSTVPTYRVIEQLYATVDATGLVTSKGTAVIHIVASVGTLTDTATLTLSQVAVRITPARAVDSVTVGDSIAPGFSAYDSRGNYISTVPALSTTAPSIARVSGSRVVGVALGTTTVTGTLDGATGQSSIVVRAAPVVLGVTTLRNAIPGTTATLVGRGFLAATTLTVDGVVVAVPAIRTDTAMSFTMPTTQACDVDGRPVLVGVTVGATTAAGTFPLNVPATWTLGIGESKTVSAAAGQCLVLPKGAGSYRISAVNLDRGNTASDIFSFQTVVSRAAVASLTPLASRSVAPVLAMRSSMTRARALSGTAQDLVSATTRPAARSGLVLDGATYGSATRSSVARIMGPSRSISGTVATTFDPRLATAVVGDTLLVPDWFIRTSTQAAMCTMPRDSVPVFKAVVYAINGNAVVLLDTRLTNMAQFAASGVQARFVLALGMVEETSLPAIRSVIDPAYAPPQGASGRHFSVVTAIPNSSASGTIWFAEGMPQTVCPNASGADFAVLAATAAGWDVGTIATVIDHERGHVSDQRYAWKTGVATGLYGAQLTSTGWAIEAFASTVQEQAARIKLGVYQGADWNGLSSVAPNVQWGIWPDPKHDLVSPWGATTTNTSTYGPYDLGSQYLTYARQLAGEGGSATAPAQTMFQRMAISRNFTIDGVAAQTGLSANDFLDAAVLALVTDDAVSATQAARYSLPQFTYWSNSVQQTVVESMVQAFNPTHYWSTTQSVTGTETLAAGSFGYFVLPTDADKGQSVRLTMTSGAPASVLRLTRIK
jgi:hypothetical protein